MFVFLQAVPPPIVVPSNLIRDFQTAAATWEPMIRTAALFLMAAFMAIDFAYSSWKRASEGADYQSIITFLCGRTIIWGIFYGFLMLNWPHIIIDGFVALGKKAGHITSATTASALFAMGVNTSGALFRSATGTGLIGGPITAFPVIAAGVIIVGAFAWLALHFVKFTVEAYTSASVGMFFLAFGTLGATRQYAERYITLLLAAGFRLQVFYLMISLANQLAAYWQARANKSILSTDAVLDTFVIAFECVLYGSLCKGIPNWVGAMLQGTVESSGSHLTGFIMPYIQAGSVAAGMGVTGAVNGVGAAVGSMPGAMGNAARGMMGVFGGGGGTGGRSPQQPSPAASLIGSSIGKAPKQPAP